ESGGEYSRTKSRFEREQAAVSQFLENLETAVRELGNAGLLAKKPEGNANANLGANPEPAKKKTASGLFGKTGASSRPAAPEANKVTSEALMRTMVGDDESDAFGGIERSDAAANQAAHDPDSIVFSRLRLGLLAKKPEGNANPNLGANPEPAKKK